MVDYSVVVPLYNEEEVISETYRRLRKVMETLDGSYEVVMINDGSRDKTAAMAKEICASDSNFKLLNFSRNFGHQTAITAGMDHASGKAIIVIDADLQDPPEIIPEMIEKWKQGFEVVYGKRVSRKGETWFKKLTAKLFYRTLNKLTDVKIPTDVGDFRLIDRKVKDALLKVPEHNRYVRGLISWLGFRQTEVEFIREARFAGETKYPLRKMIKLAVDGITSFSYKPLKFSIGTGIFLSVSGLIFALVVVILRLNNIVSMEPGWASLMVVCLFFFGFVLIMLGIIGEYIGRIFEEVKGRPLYIVSEKVGDFGEKEDPRG
ncbi:glycosyltransferase [Candidatus Nomurabacteria bacterium]|nr:glycosyltransferase [Candidatus Nomurabacteria bacterium]